MKKKEFFLSVFWLGLTMTTSPLLAEQSETMLTIGSHDQPPFIVTDENTREVSGLYRDIAEAVFRKINVKAKFIMFPTKRGIKMIEDGELDATLDENWQRWHKKGIIHEPANMMCYLHTEWGMWIIKKNKGALKYETLEDLKGKNLGYILGYGNDPEFTAYTRKHCKSVQTVYRVQQNFRKLLAGRIDYAFYERVAGLYVTKQMGRLEDFHFFKW